MFWLEKVKSCFGDSSMSPILCRVDSRGNQPLLSPSMEPVYLMTGSVMPGTGYQRDKEGQCVALSTHPSSCPAAALSSRQACSLRESVTNSH